MQVFVMNAAKDENGRINLNSLEKLKIRQP
jgi:hypothetical protein